MKQKTQDSCMVIATILSLVAICFSLMSFARSEAYVKSVKENAISSVSSISSDDAIPMLHQDQMYEMIKEIDGLTDQTRESIAIAWADTTNNLCIQVNPMWEDGSFIETYLATRDGVLTVVFHNAGFDHIWYISRWDWDATN